MQLYESCIPVKGYLRSIIYDLQRSHYFFVPNEMLLFLKKYKKRPFSINDSNLNEIEKSYYHFLVKNDLVFICNNNDKNSFPEINLDYDTPELIFKINLKIDKNLNYEKINFIINTSNAKIINVYLTENSNLGFINRLIKSIKNSTIKNLNIYIDENVFDENKIESVFEIDERIKFVFILTDEILSDYTLNKRLANKVYKLPKKYNEIFNIKQTDFIVETSLFIESQTKNTYYNKTIFIDEQGYLLSSFSDNNKHYNIKDIINKSDLECIIASKTFETIYSLSKIKIDICKHCEFRHMCIDNRLPIKRNDKNWFMTTECNYNPYISKWKTEEGYKNLAECGVISNKNGFKINRKKINSINKALWGDD